MFPRSPLPLHVSDRSASLPGSLFNHASNPNVSFNLSYSTYTIQYKTFRTVEAGEELCIFYGHDTHFSEDGEEKEAIAGGDTAEGEDSWGGLAGIANEDLPSASPSDSDEEEEDLVARVEAIGKVDDAEKSNPDEEFIPWEELPWDKITDLEDPQEAELTTRSPRLFFLRDCLLKFVMSNRGLLGRRHAFSISPSRFRVSCSSLESTKGC